MMQKILLLFSILFITRIVDITAQEVSVNLPMDAATTCGQEVTIPVTVAGYANVNTLRFQVEWDTLAFEFVSFENTTNIILLADVATTPRFVSAGVLGSPSDLADGETLFVVTLRAISENISSSDVFISDVVSFGGSTIDGTPINIIRDTTTYAVTQLCNTAMSPTITCPTQNVFTIGQGQTTAIINGLAPTINNDDGTVNILYNLVFNNVTISNGTDDASGETFNIGTTTLTYLLVDTNGDIVDQCQVGISLVEEVGVADGTILIETTSSDCSDIVCVDVNIGAIENIADMQFAIEWNPTLMSLNSAALSAGLQGGTNSSLLGITQAVNGIVTFSFLDLSLNGADFAANDNLFTLCFQPVANGIATLDFTANGLAGGGSIQVNESDGAGGVTDITEQVNFVSGSVTISNCTTTTTNGFSIEDATIDCSTNSQACVPVRASNLENLANLQFSINWNSNILQFDRTQNVSASLSQDIVDFGTLSTNNGILNFSWADLGTGQSFADNELLFEICFNGIANGDAGLTFSNNETPIVVNQYDANQNQIDISDDISFANGTVAVSNCTTTNPSTNNITLSSTTSNCETDVPACVNVSIAAFDSLANIQFSINWDPNIIRFTSTINNDLVLNPTATNYGTMRSAEGILNFSWFDLGANGQNFNEGDVLFTLCFDPINNGNAGLTFSNNETPIMVNQYDANLNQIEITNNVSFVDGAIAVTNCSTVTPQDGVLIQGATIDCNATADQSCVDVNISELENLANIQFSVNWDTAVLRFVSANNNDLLLNASATNYGVLRVTEGILNFSWFDLNASGQDFAANDRLFTLCFDPVGEGNANLVISNNETPIQVNQYINDQEQVEITNTLSFGANTVMVADTIAPTMTNCPTETIVLYTSANSCLVAGMWAEPTFEDACSEVIVVGSDIPGDLFGLGDRIIQYTGADNAGNSATCSFTLSVRDTIAPTVSNCPSNQTINLSAATECNPTATWTRPTAVDACSSIPIIVSNFQPGDTFPRGQTMVTYTIRDSSGNVNNDCSFIVELTGEAPVRLSACPDNITRTFSVDTGCDISVDWTPPILVQGCSVGDATLMSNFEPGDQFPVGVSTVTYIASDAGGNSDSCSFTVTLTGSNPIVFPNCPGNIEVNALQNQCGANVGWTEPTTTGGCGSVNLLSNFIPNDFFPVGTTTVSYTASDEASQTSICNFTVTVVDEQPLAAICPQDIEVDASGNILSDASNFINTASFEDCGIVRIQYNDITAFDNCDSDISRTLTQGLQSNSLFQDTTVMSIDLRNMSEDTTINCSFRIIIREPVPVVTSLSTPFVCSSQSLTLQASTVPNATYTWSGPNGFVSNEQNPIISNPDIFNTGSYRVTATVPGGCVVTDSINVEVNQGPIITASANELECGGGTIELMADGMEIDAYEWSGPNAYTSNEQNPTINNALAVQAGVYTVVATSTNGCTAEATTEVVIQNIPPPTVNAFGTLRPGIACERQAIELKGSVYPGEVTYNWTVSDPDGGLPSDVNDSLITVTPTNAGTYTYTYTADLGSGCVADTFIVLEILPSPEFMASTNAPIECAMSGSQLSLNTTTSDTDIVSWLWQGPNDYAANTPDAEISDVTSMQSGTYTVMATGENGCIATDSVIVTISNQPAIPDLGADRLSACEGALLQLMPQEFPENTTYLWTGPNGFSSTDSIVNIDNALPENAGGYQLVQSMDGCPSNPATIIVSVLTDPELMNDSIPHEYQTNLDFEVISNDMLAPGAGFTINILEGGTRTDAIENEAGRITSNGDGQFNFVPVQDWIGQVQFAYEICYEDCPELCGMAVVTINTDVPADTCIIPGVISPNGDAKNDLLIISCNAVAKGGGITIFNQWGAKVFEQFPYENNWDGTYEGEDLPDGVYYYIYLETDDAEPIKGSVTIFR